MTICDVYIKYSVCPLSKVVYHLNETYRERFSDTVIAAVIYVLNSSSRMNFEQVIDDLK